MANSPLQIRAKIGINKKAEMPDLFPILCAVTLLGMLENSDRNFKERCEKLEKCFFSFLLF
jgi:hypothetical protein